MAIVFTGAGLVGAAEAMPVFAVVATGLAIVFTGAGLVGAAAAMSVFAVVFVTEALAEELKLRARPLRKLVGPALEDCLAVLGDALGIAVAATTCFLGKLSGFTVAVFTVFAGVAARRALLGVAAVALIVGVFTIGAFRATLRGDALGAGVAFAFIAVTVGFAGAAFGAGLAIVTASFAGAAFGAGLAIGTDN